MSRKQRYRIGISLSGGGARGAAHIGVLQALLENDIEPEIVSGTSAGAIIGALYAAGLSPAAMLEFVKQSSVLKLIRVGMPIGGLTKLTYLKERLAEVIPEDSFESLQRELYIAITNLNTGKLEIRSEGPLFDVILASCSIPLMFKPVEIDGQLYVDGGVLSNLPVACLRERTDFLIGVNVMPHIDVESKNVQNFLGIAFRCFDLSIRANTQPMAALCDVCIEPVELNEYHIFQFSRLQQMYELGYQSTLEQMGGIREKLAGEVAATLPAGGASREGGLVARPAGGQVDRGLGDQGPGDQGA